MAPDIQAQQGTPNELPRGEATELNDALDAVPQAPEIETPEEFQAATPADYEPKFVPETDDESFITGPSTRPDEPVTAGTMSGGGTVMPKDLRNALPIFLEAAQRPDAPEQLKILAALLKASALS